MSKTSLFAFVFGGIGILDGVCHWLTEEGYDVYVVSKHQHQFERMKQNSKHPDKLFPLTVDYHDDQTLQESVRQAIQQHGCCPDLIVSYMHNSAPNALPIILKEVSTRTDPWKLIHIQGSSSFFVKENTTVPKPCEYRRVYLGFVDENDSPRWLTNEEVANGIIKVIKRDFKETIIGTLKPWSKRLS